MRGISQYLIQYSSYLKAISPSSTNIGLDDVRAMLHGAVHHTQVDERKTFLEDSYQGYAIEEGSKGVKKLEDCSGQQPHRLKSYDPSSLTTVVSVPECRVQRYSAFIAVFHRHWLVLRDPFCDKGVPSRQSGSRLRKALAGISEQSRKESTAGALKCAAVISLAVCADRQGQRKTHSFVQSPPVVGRILQSSNRLRSLPYNRFTSKYYYSCECDALFFLSRTLSRGTECHSVLRIGWTFELCNDYPRAIQHVELCLINASKGLFSGYLEQ